MKTIAEDSLRVNTVPYTATNRHCIVQMAPLPVKRKIPVCLYRVAFEALHHWPLRTHSALNLKLVPSLQYKCLLENSLHLFLIVVQAHRLLCQTLPASA